MRAPRRLRGSKADLTRAARSSQDRCGRQAAGFRAAPLRDGLPARPGRCRAGATGPRRGGRLTERALAISERFRPVFEFLTLVDRPGSGLSRAVDEALASVQTARLILSGTKGTDGRADELEAFLRLAHGGLGSATGWRRPSAAARHAAGQGRARRRRSPRRCGTAGAAVLRRPDAASRMVARCSSPPPPSSAETLGGRRRRRSAAGRPPRRLPPSVVTTAPQVTRPSSSTRPSCSRSPPGPDHRRRPGGPHRPGAYLRCRPPLTRAGLRTSNCCRPPTSPDGCDPLRFRNTVETRLRSIYRAGSVPRSQAVERALDLHLL